MTIKRNVYFTKIAKNFGLSIEFQLRRMRCSSEVIENICALFFEVFFLKIPHGTFDTKPLYLGDDSGCGPPLFYFNDGVFVCTFSSSKSDVEYLFIDFNPDFLGPVKTGYSELRFAA